MYTSTTLASTGNVGGANGGFIHAVIVTGGSDACAVTFSAANPTTVLVVKVPTVQTVAISNLDISYAGQLVATITGTAPSITVVH
jgi:hypothetical protein